MLADESVLHTKYAYIYAHSLKLYMVYSLFIWRMKFN